MSAKSEDTNTRNAPSDSKADFRAAKKFPTTNVPVPNIFDAASAGDLQSVKHQIEKKKVGVNSKAGDGVTPLMKASANGRLEIVKFLVQKGANVNQTDQRGYTALLWALEKPPEYLNVTKELVEKSAASVNVQDLNGGYTPLHKVAQSGNLEAVKYLVENGARVDAKTKKGDSPVDLAAAHNRVNVLEYFLDEQKVPYDAFKAVLEKGYTSVLEGWKEAANAVDPNGWTMLHRAASAGRLDAVKCLIEKRGVNVNVNNSRRGAPATPLHAAVEKNQTDVVSYLVNKGADLNARDANGRTPLFWAAYNGHWNLVAYFIDMLKLNAADMDNSGKTLLHATCAGNGNLTLFRYLMESERIDVNACDDDGQTALIECIQRGKLDISEYIVVVHNVNVNVTDKSGCNAIHYAAGKGYLPLLKTLVHKPGANYMSANLKGQTPLDFASTAGHLDTVKYLIDDLGVYYTDQIFGAAERGYLPMIRYFVEVKLEDANQSDEQGWSLLHRAAYNGRMDIVKYLVDQARVNVNAKHRKNGIPFTALHAACQKNHVQIAKYLADKGADESIRDASGRTPVYWAAENGSLELVKYFLDDKYADPTQRRTDDGSTLLHAAVLGDNLELVKYLIKEKGLDANDKNDSGQTVALKSLIENKVNILRYLLDEDLADFRAVDKEGKTYLHQAALRGQIAIVRTLIEKGADVEAKDFNGRTPLFHAVLDGNLNEVRYFLAKTPVDALQTDNSGDTLLHAAASNGDLDLVKYLLETKGLDVDAKNKDGRTALFTAIKLNRSNVFQYLLVDKLADFRIADQDGRTCLHEAATRGHLAIVKRLVEKGADIEAKDNAGRTPVFYAAAGTKPTGGHLDVLKYFVEEKHVDPRKKDKHGNTVLHLACESDSLDVVKYLVEEKKMDVNETDDNGYAALFFSSNGGKVFRYLLEERSADFRVSNNIGVTSLHRAAFKGDLAMVKALVEKGADIDVRDNNGGSPVYYAVHGGNLDVVRYFVDQKKADVHQRSQLGVTLLHGAALAGSLSIAKYLVEEKGLDVNVVAKNGKTPLGAAQEKMKSDVAAYLRSKGGRERRYRREVAQPFVTNSAYRHSSSINGAGQSVQKLISGMLSLSSESFHVAANPMNLGFLNGLLALLSVGYGKFYRTRSVADCGQEQALLSPNQIIRQRIDPNATIAVHNSPNFFELER